MFFKSKGIKYKYFIRHRQSHTRENKEFSIDNQEYYDARL